MNPLRIAELLGIFLSVPTAAPNHCARGPSRAEFQSPCDSARAQASEEPQAAVLSSAQLTLISTYIDILLRWNARINLTAIRDPEEIVTRHFGESLFAARHLFPHDPRRETAALEQSRRGSTAESGPAALTLADVGSGAGFPGLPIKLWVPQIALTLIEFNYKKAAFLREVTRALTLTDVDIRNARAEAIAPNTFEVVTLRAVERFASVLPVAAALVAPSGRLALLIGASQQDQARASLPQFSWGTAVPVPGSRARILLIGTTPLRTGGYPSSNSGPNEYKEY
jgi:16S rRNA (guanine527-N7)-methyltransferase